MTVRDLVRIALFAAIIAALGLLPRIDIPIAAGVPITAQTLGVMLAGVMLGARLGALAVLLFLFVVALGAPLLAGGRGGLGVLFGPTAGYLIGWIAGAYVCGLLMRALRGLPLFAATLIAAIGGGILVVYAFGVPWLAWKANLSLTQAILGGLVFVPGDLIKAVATAFITVATHRSAPSLISGRA
ncbi:MAG: biotin transporter BioY [Xanthobacteraceae bacterium]|nr:MAG: biotin transporter BioY [Xanthobacteraceae bacterium]